MESAEKPVYIPTLKEKKQLIEDLSGAFQYFVFVYDDEDNYNLLNIELAERLDHELEIVVTPDGEWKYGESFSTKPVDYGHLLGFLIKCITRDKHLLPYHITNSFRLMRRNGKRIEKKLNAIYDMLSCVPGAPEFTEAAERFKKAAEPKSSI